jgi:tRNA 2-selenouridine synthase
MTVQTLGAADAVARLETFGAVVDVRSPAEFAQDRLPGAVNWPVLGDEERIRVGTEYKRISAFEAQKRGAAIVARNIALHIERHVMAQPRGWQPLVYCWRGGKRSGAMAWFLDQMGFRTHVVEGGYKAFRALVRSELDAPLPQRLRYTVLCGRTGSGKTRLLHALSAADAQVLDLEGLARHRGSVLGLAPGEVQPGQKAFETALWNALRGFDASRPVFVESESRRIGQLRVPEALIARLREHGRCVRIDMPDAGRLALLLDDYEHFVRDAEFFCRQLDALVPLRGREPVARWQAAARAGRFGEVFLDLMHRHYDPGYDRSMRANFAGFDAAPVVALADAAPATLAAAAGRLADEASQRCAG